MSVTSGPAASYTYDSMSRLKTVSDGTRSASYSRVSGSSLLASTAINNGSADILTVNRTYDTLDRLTNITSNGISYNYTYDNADKRTKNVLSDGSYWLYEYDDLGQVTKGKKYTASGVEVVGQSFGYDYDDIGNLKTENRNGNVFKYTANSVNQYTQRTVPSRINISGSADASAKVTIKQGTTYTRPQRYGNYFNAFFNLDNSSNSVSDSFDIYAVKYDGAKDIVAKQSLNVFVAKTPEQFTYDNDGNLLTDGKFTYTWDAENRLIKAEYSDTRIEFVYDYMGRRTNKKLYVNNVLTSETKFTYDGWNLVAEYNGSNVLQNSYLWGEDLSGSLQGAGGVGGLLSTTSYTSSMSYIPCYDGNGNITTYLDNSGNVVATYQYDPFGKLICAFGSKSDDMLYRFSTKYFDKETALYYYGYRYYNPETSRWLSRDPIEEQGGNNLYTFVNNNSVSQWDLLGLTTPYKIGRNAPPEEVKLRNDWDTAKGTNLEITTFYAKWIWERAMWSVSGGYMAHRKEPADLLLHFILNTGSNYTIDFAKMNKESSEAKMHFKLERYYAQLEAERLTEEKSKTFSYVSIMMVTTKESHMTSNQRSSWNWLLAINLYRTWATAKVERKGKCLKMKWELHLRDNYDWELNGFLNGGAGGIVSDREMKLMHLNGYFRSFKIIGTDKDEIEWEAGKAEFDARD